VVEKIAQVSWLVREDAVVGNSHGFCTECIDQVSANEEILRIQLRVLILNFCDGWSRRIRKEL
jgi:hypothetical protein